MMSTGNATLAPSNDSRSTVDNQQNHLQPSDDFQDVQFDLPDQLSGSPKAVNCCSNPLPTLQGYSALNSGGGGSTKVAISGCSAPLKKYSTSMCIRFVFVFVILLTAAIFVHASWRSQQRPLQVSRISERTELEICHMTNTERFKRFLAPFLVTRIVDTEQHRKVASYIQKTLNKLNFTIDMDEFTERTPHGDKRFRNIIATYNPDAPRRLVLACHYDSKIFPGAQFIGATDSAVPCAMLLDIATTLAPLLRIQSNKEVTLQLLFLDGEEAFVEWTRTDSLYGARHLAKHWEEKSYTSPQQSAFSMNKELDRIDVFVLLDLLGAPKPHIRNLYGLLANNLFEELPAIEDQLQRLGCLHRLPQMFFSGLAYGAVEDDHIPFLRRGIPVLHIIPTPFPSVWHTLRDNESALDYRTIDNLISVMRVFVVKYLGLVP